MNQDFDERKERAISHFVVIKRKRLAKIKMQQVYDAIHKYSFNKREHRLAKLHTLENIKTTLIRKALIKWQLRKKITVKMRSICARGKRVKKGLNLKAVFAAWKSEFTIVKRFCCRVD